MYYIPYTLHTLVYSVYYVTGILLMITLIDAEFTIISLLYSKLQVAIFMVILFPCFFVSLQSSLL